VDLRRGSIEGGGGIFYETLYHKILLRGGGDGARDLAGDFGLQLGVFYKNWDRNIFELGLQLGWKYF